MKKIVLPYLLLLSFISFSQSITVNTNTYTVPQLVNNVLINSPCINTSNISWRTGTNFGSSNGIGYFQNTNPNFPMESGVILSTGNVLNAPGPNTTILNDGSTSWTGDASLESVLAASGITMNSINATVLEFDFVPISQHFSFDFLFASEEYGNFQCQFSDAFAFLLTNLNTGVTTNLAVVPGTNAPISVVTIRDFLYNSTCNSVNPQYFGTFNGGSNAATAAINFNGQTVMLNASSVLQANVPYRIKLVVADRTDVLSDSAIFLSSDSFNVGQNVLGDDITIAANTAPCFGNTQIIDSGLDPTLYTFVWKKNGVVLNGENGPSINVTTPGNYELTYTNITFTCESIVDSILVEYQPELITPNPIDLYKCNTGASLYNYNLAQNTTVVTAGLPSGSTATYFESAINAENNTSALPINYNSAGNQTVYVRITKGNSNCYVVKSFQLLLTNPPVATMPMDFYMCSSATQPDKAWFTLTDLNSEILNGQSPSIYQVNYYLTQSSALSGTNPLNSTYFTSNTTIYASVQLITESGCRSVTSVNLIVIPRPLVDDLEDIITCTDYTLLPLTNGNYFTGQNGTGTALFAGDIISQSQIIYIYNTTSTTPSCSNQTDFNVFIIKPDDLEIEPGTYCSSYTLPTLDFGNYYTEAGGNGTVIPSGSVITTSQVVYFYIHLTDPVECIIDLPFSINITIPQQVAELNNVFDCTFYTLQPLTFGAYYDQQNGQGNVIPAGTQITSSQIIYIYGETNGCPDESNFQVVIGINFPTDVTECVSFTLPQLTVGGYFTQPLGQGTEIPAGTVINATQTIYVYAVTQNQPNCTDNYNFTVSITLPEITTPVIPEACYGVTLPSIPIGNYYTESGGQGTMMNAGDYITESKTLYVYLNDGLGCVNEKSFQVTVSPQPKIDSRDNQTPCNAYTLTNLSNGDYYTGPNATGTLLHGGDVITTSQTIYIYAVNNLGCASQNSFTLDITTVQADTIANVTICDSYILPQLTSGNHYYTATGGQNGTGTELFAGTTISTNQTIYVYKESADRINCSDEKSFSVTLIPTPFIGTVNPVFACTSYTLPALAVGNYFSQTGGTGTQLNAGDVISTSQTIYIYSETGTSPVNCTDEKALSITIFNVDNLPNVTTCVSFTLPVLTIGKYYTQSGGNGTQLFAGNSINTSQTIYIYAQSGYNPNCYDQTFFTVTVINRPFVNAIPTSQTTICDTDGTNDGIFNFDLTSLNATALGSQIGTEFSVTYYGNFNDANANSNAVTSTTNTTAFIRVSNSLAPDCYDIKQITIIVHKIPEVTLKDGIVCIDSATGNLLNSYTIETGLSSATHTFQWFDATGNVIATSNYYVATAAGTYSLIATNNATGCSSEETFVTVNPSEPAIVAYTVNDDFSSNQTVTVVATGTGGDYEYQLDNGNFQDSPIFDVVSSGIHTITVRDKNGCGVTTIEALFINYPHYFTPNGDGFHETWNILDLKDQPQASITIFDRYGKILKEIKPSGQGWDGIYNGQLMISDDYWFSLTYYKNNIAKEFKAHFSLKR